MKVWSSRESGLWGQNQRQVNIITPKWLKLCEGRKGAGAVVRVSMV